MNEWRNYDDVNIVEYGGTLIRQVDEYPECCDVYVVTTSWSTDTIAENNLYVEYYYIDLKNVDEWDWKNVCNAWCLSEKEFASLSTEEKTYYFTQTFLGTSILLPTASGEYTVEKFLKICEHHGVDKNTLRLPADFDAKYVTIDLEELYKKYAPDNSKCGEINLSYGKIKASVINVFSGKPQFYDFIGPHNNGISCMTTDSYMADEKCKIIFSDSKSVTLRNYQGEKSTDFILSLDEFEIASGESNSLNLIVKEAVKQKDSTNKDSKENEISGIDRGER